jgi:hypothetical protein
MKPKPIFRFLRWPPLLTRLRRRVLPPRPVMPFVPPEERPRRRRVRYLPIWVGCQILPLPLFEEHSDEPRDIYDMD